MGDRESRIRQRAYRLWEEDGSPTGMEAEHWARAERELFSNGAEPVSEAATQSASAGKRPAVRSKSRAAKSPGATSRGRTSPPK